MKQASINVLIVTYKQADVIGRNIESILRQKEYGLNKIVICDDCSPDNNWEVIQGYVKQYPDIIVAYRNNPNLGIYGNSSKLASLCGEADLYCWLEGDDALCDGFFKSSQDFIKENQIDLSKGVGIFGDYYSVSPDGNKKRVKNDFVVKGYSPYGSYLRSIASWRASLFSSSIIKQFQPVICDKGLILAETLFDSQWFRFLEKAYYNPVVGSIYYTGIGVSVTLGLSKSDSEYKTTETIRMWEFLKENGYITKQEDIAWANSKIAQSKCIQKFSVKTLHSFFKNGIKGLRGYRVDYCMLFLQVCHLIVISIKK